MAIVIIEQEELAQLISNSVQQALQRHLTIRNVPEDAIEDELLQIEQVADLLNVSFSTVHNYKKNGVIPFHRIGRRVYFKKIEVLECLKKIN